MVKLKHVYHKCNKPDCYVCNGGLGSCTVCHGAEASLPTDCPGVKMTAEQQDAIQAGTLNYHQGKWWGAVTPKAMREILDTGSENSREEMDPKTNGTFDCRGSGMRVSDGRMSINHGQVKVIAVGLEDGDDEDAWHIVQHGMAGHKYNLKVRTGSPQEEVHSWLYECMGPDVAFNLEERNWRVAEEFCELLHATGMPLEDLIAVAKYVYAKDASDSYVAFELADALICLCAMATAYEVDLEAAFNYVNKQNWKKIGKIRAKHDAKRFKSPALAIAKS